MLYHILAWVLGYILDRILGDPQNFPHPVRAIGAGISRLGKYLNRETDSPKRRRQMGRLTVVVMLVLVGSLSGLLTVGAYMLHPVVGILTETILTYYLLATKSLRVESEQVKIALESEGLPAARQAVSRIVGRDTEHLTEAGVIKAAVETVAENSSDGVLAPMLYSLLGGPILGWLYKTVNTMDSMIGYKNETYLDYGRAAAKLDDVVNFIPARVSALLLILAAHMMPKTYSGRDAMRIWKRDRRNHASPNSAQTEAACAGALRVLLAGDASYFGKVVKKPTIGDDLRPVEAEDIVRANDLMTLASLICLLIGVGILIGINLLF